MGADKSTAIYLEKTPFPEKEKKTSCTSAAVSWMLGVLLLLSLVVILVEFLYPIEDMKCNNCMEGIFYKSKVVDKNPWDLDFLVNSPEICSTTVPPESEEYQKDPEIKILVLVSSAPSHFKQRAAIRSTWGLMAQTPFSPLRLGFVLGTTKNKTEEKLIKDESFNYKDIIQANFEDTMTTKQTTNKSILMLKWVANNCPHTMFYLKTEDDTFVNVHTLAIMLGSEPFVSEEKFIGGNIDSKKTAAQKNNKLGFSPDIFDASCVGSAYVMPGHTAVKLFDMSNNFPSNDFLSFDNVFETDSFDDIFDAALLHDPRFGFQNPPISLTWPDISPLATAHGFAPDGLENIWKDMLQHIVNPLLQQELVLNETVSARKRRAIN